MGLASLEGIKGQQSLKNSNPDMKGRRSKDCWKDCLINNWQLAHQVSELDAGG
jgi:hypothetical protein